ncbi:hypothetical protein JCM21900_000176 [Sporobolomyces salmonicolor]
MSRITARAPEDEDASQLKFGPEFGQYAVQERSLTISEVRIILDNMEHKPDNAIFQKTQDYVDTFARFHAGEVVEAVRESLPSDKFKFYEIAQLINLCPADAEEAKALVPSVTMDDDTLQQHLNDLAMHRKHQG